MTKADYDAAKDRYRQAGKKARGKPHDSVEWRAYEKAKREYHHAGEMLRKAKQ